MWSFFRDLHSIAESLSVIAAHLTQRRLVKDEAEWLWGSGEATEAQARRQQTAQPPELFTYDPARHYALEQKDEEAPR